MTSTNIGWIAAALIVSCAALQNIPEGDSRSSATVLADDLEGKWCDPRPEYLLCFEAHNGHYSWSASDCAEYGDLQDGLEFHPRAYNADGVPLCYAPSVPGDGLLPYLATVTHTSIGLHVYFANHAEPLDLTYVPELQP